MSDPHPLWSYLPQERRTARDRQLLRERRARGAQGESRQLAVSSVQGPSISGQYLLPGGFRYLLTARAGAAKQQSTNPLVTVRVSQLGRQGVQLCIRAERN